MATVTCRTAGCINDAVPIDLALTYPDENGDTQSVDAVVCGACGQDITDISNDERESA